MFRTELVGICFGHAVFGKQTDLLHAVQTRKAFWLILRDADIAHSVRRECSIVLADWRDFAVTIDCTHTSPCKAANLALVRSAGDDMMKYVIVGPVSYTHLVPKSTLISALKKKLRREYNHFGWSICAALGLAITGFFAP